MNGAANLDDERLADDYVVGVLERGERESVEGRMVREPKLVVKVAQAIHRFDPLNETVEPAQLPDDSWERLLQRIEAGARRADGVARPRAANDNRLRWWRAGALASAAAAIVLAVILGTNISGIMQPDVIAVLLRDDGTPFALVADDGEGNARVTPLADYDIPEGRTLQVWTKWSEEVGPVSLGILDAIESARVGAQGRPSPEATQLYEITVEDEGGSPTGLPTGPIVAIGNAQRPR